MFDGHVSANNTTYRLQNKPNFDSILFCPITLDGRRSTKDDFATISFRLVLFSAAIDVVHHGVSWAKFNLTESIPLQAVYSRTSIARTLMARLPRLFRTHS